MGVGGKIKMKALYQDINYLKKLKSISGLNHLGDIHKWVIDNKIISRWEALVKMGNQLRDLDFPYLVECPYEGYQFSTQFGHAETLEEYYKIQIKAIQETITCSKCQTSYSYRISTGQWSFSKDQGILIIIESSKPSNRDNAKIQKKEIPTVGELYQLMYGKEPPGELSDINLMKLIPETLRL